MPPYSSLLLVTPTPRLPPARRQPQTETSDRPTVTTGDFAHEPDDDPRDDEAPR